MTPNTKYKMTARSLIVRSEKPTKGLEAIEAPNPHQANRIKGYLSDGTHVVIAQRPGGKGGMDFNKIMGGKVFAVAADGASPVYEKENGKATKVQKTEDGLPLYSSSGFYLLSSKDYPALELLEGYTLLQQKGAIIYILTEAQLEAKSRSDLSGDLDWDLLSMDLAAALSDELNLVARFDAQANKRRLRGIEDAKRTAEDNEEQYTGKEYKEVKVSKKDGNPFIFYTWKSASGVTGHGLITRQVDHTENDRTLTQYFTPEEAMEGFAKSDAFAKLSREWDAGHSVDFAWAQGHVMRTSVSFRRKVENVLAAPAEKQQYGEAVYIQGALRGWTRALMSVMHSMHPNFPQDDYDAHHYVVAPRQAEVGMNQSGDKWTPPQALNYNLTPHLLAPGKA